MKNPKDHFSSLWPVAALSLFVGIPSHGQGGKEFVQWLQQYSPTGYFIINDYESRTGNKGAYKEFIVSTTAPVPGTPVHETCHMLNGLNSTGNAHAYHVGGGKTLKVTPNFTPFHSDMMIGDIAQQFRNFQYEVYVIGGNAYSNVGGLYGLFEEFSAYATENRATLEMIPCFKANFNTTQNWNDMANDQHFTTMSLQEFRYFCLRYMLYAKKSNTAVYNGVLASQDTKIIYTTLVQYASQNALDWEAAMKAQGRNTTTADGWDDYWLFFNEMKKQEYLDMEALMWAPTPIIASRPEARRLVPNRVLLPAGMFDVQGRALRFPRPAAPFIRN